MEGLYRTAVTHIDDDVFVGQSNHNIFQRNYQQVHSVRIYIAHMLQLDRRQRVGGEPNFSPLIRHMIDDIWLIGFNCIQQIYADLSNGNGPVPLDDDKKCLYDDYNGVRRIEQRKELQSSSVYQMELMFDNEQLHSDRRLLALVANAGYFSKDFGQMLLVKGKTGAEGDSFCQLLIKSLQIIGSMVSLFDL